VLPSPLPGLLIRQQQQQQQQLQHQQQQHQQQQHQQQQHQHQQQQQQQHPSHLGSSSGNHLIQKQSPPPPLHVGTEDPAQQLYHTARRFSQSVSIARDLSERLIRLDGGGPRTGSPDLSGTAGTSAPSIRSVGTGAAAGDNNDDNNDAESFEQSSLYEEDGDEDSRNGESGTCISESAHGGIQRDDSNHSREMASAFMGVMSMFDRQLTGAGGAPA
jgi:type II secretory pathway pseudopilin PulG